MVKRQHIEKDRMILIDKRLNELANELGIDKDVLVGIGEHNTNKRRQTKKAFANQCKDVINNSFAYFTDGSLRKCSAAQLATVIAILYDKRQLSLSKPTTITQYQKKINISAKVMTRDELKDRMSSSPLKDINSNKTMEVVKEALESKGSE